MMMLVSRKLSKIVRWIDTDMVLMIVDECDYKSCDGGTKCYFDSLAYDYNADCEVGSDELGCDLSGNYHGGCMDRG